MQKSRGKERFGFQAGARNELLLLEKQNNRSGKAE